MKHLLSILIFLSFMSVANAVLTLPLGKTSCISQNWVWNYDKEICQSGIDWSDIGSGIDLGEPLSNEELKEIRQQEEQIRISKENNELIVLIILIFIGGVVALLIINKSVKKTKEVYKSSTIPLKNKVKRKELETRLNELDEVKPAEHTYNKTAYVDDTEEINEVKKLERQIKIKKLQKELKDLEEE